MEKDKIFIDKDCKLIQEFISENSSHKKKLENYFEKCERYIDEEIGNLKKSID